MQKKDTPISKKFHDYFRSFLKQVKRPIKKNFLELSRGLILGSTVIVSEIVRINNNDCRVRKGVERIGNMLDKIESYELNGYMIATKYAPNIHEKRAKPRKVYFEDFKEKKTQVEIKNKKTNRFELITVKLSKAKVRLTKNDEQLNVVRIRRLKKGAKTIEMYLLTTLKASGINQMISAYETYLKRWKIEELFRSIKQHFQIEKIQLRKLNRIQSLYRLIVMIHNFLTDVSCWSESVKNSIFYHAKQLQKNTQKMSLFTAILKLTQKEWSYWKYNLHSMFFRSNHNLQNQLQLNLSFDYLTPVL